MSDYSTVDGDDTPEGQIDGVEELPQPDEFSSRSPGSAMTESDVVGRRDRDESDELDSPEPEEKSEYRELSDEELEKVARDALDGKYGHGQTRRQGLAEAGFDPSAVEAAVVRLLNPQPEEG